MNANAVLPVSGQRFLPATPQKNRRASMNRKRRWKRWVSVGRADLHRLVWIARKVGMACIGGYKAGFCCWNAVALYGTSEQMRSAEARWRDLGHTIETRQPGGAFGLRTDVPPEEWAEHELQSVGRKPDGIVRRK